MNTTTPDVITTIPSANPLLIQLLNLRTVVRTKLFKKAVETDLKLSRLLERTLTEEKSVKAVTAFEKDSRALYHSNDNELVALWDLYQDLGESIKNAIKHR